MSNQTAWDYLVIFITVAALGIGLISMTVGQIAAWRERLDQRSRPRRRVAAPARRQRPTTEEARQTKRDQRMANRLSHAYMAVRGAIEPVRFMQEPAQTMPVLPQLHHLDENEPCENEPAREPPQLNRLSRTAEITLLAVQRNADGTYRHSANAITHLMGGTAADVKKQIAEIRALPPEEQPKIAPRMDRPPRGWPKGALN